MVGGLGAPSRPGSIPGPIRTGCHYYQIAAVDLFITDPPDSLVLVAMSDDGLLRRNPTGIWERDVLGMAAPLFATNSHITQEWFAALALMLAAALVLTLVAHRRLSTVHRARMGAWPIIGLVVLRLAAMLSGQRSLMVDDELFVPVLSGGVILLSLVGLAGPMAVWSRLSSERPQTVRSHALVSLVGILSLGAALVPFVAWSSGTIAHWETAALTAGVATLAVIILTWWRISRLEPVEEPLSARPARPSPKPRKPPPTPHPGQPWRLLSLGSCWYAWEPPCSSSSQWPQRGSSQQPWWSPSWPYSGRDTADQQP